MLKTLGISWVVTELPGLPAVARRCEEVGFGVIAVPDSQASVYRDVFLRMTVAVQATERARVASPVVNPVTRHVATTAGAAASLRELAGSDRIVLGVGDSAPASLRMCAVRQHELVDYIDKLRVLWAGQPVERGQRMQVH